jgi:hypothetical protein
VEAVRAAVLAGLVVLAGCASTPATPPGATAPFDGVTYRLAPPLADRPMRVHVLEVNLRRPGTRLMITPPDRSGGLEYRAQTVSTFLKAHGLQAAINGGYFLPFKGGSPGGDDFVPQAGDGANVSGASWGMGREASPVELDLADELNYDRRVTVILCIDDGVRVSIRDGQVCPGGTEDSLSAGPRLLRAGIAEPADPNRPPPSGDRTAGGPRTAVGVSKDGRRVWLVVVDGRQPGFSEGASTPELKTLFLALGAHDAMNFDGGGSSTMVVAGPEGPKVVSSPIHTGVPGRERPSANHLGVFARPLRQAP